MSRFTRLTTPQIWGSQNLPPYSILCVWPQGLHPNVILSWDSQVGSPKIFEIGTPTTLEGHNFLCRPWIEVRFQAKLYPSLRAFQQYVACHLHVSKSGRFLNFSGEESIGSLIPDPSFGHNLCFKYPNGSCKPILNIYVPRDFQWYKEFFNPMNFNLYKCSLKIQESIESPTPKIRIHLGVCEFIPSHSPTLMGA
jgi:hypothetical protein